MILFKKITTKQEKVSIIGLGYVGMPLAVAFAKKADVIGFEGVRGRFPVTHHKDKIRFGLFCCLAYIKHLFWIIILVVIPITIAVVQWEKQLDCMQKL